MKLGMALTLAVMTAGSMGCAAGHQVVRSPGFMPQPIGRAVVGQCYVEDDVHTIRHAVDIQRPGQLAIRTDVKTGSLNAEILLKSPDGSYVQHLVTNPAQRSYEMNLQAERGTWEIVVVCRSGVASYTVEAEMAPVVTLGATP